MTYRVDRSLLLERDPAKLAGPALVSIRDADFRHQKAAMLAGYSSVAEMAIDEMIAMMRDLQERVDRLERELANVRGELHEIEP